MSTMKTCGCDRKHYRVAHRNHNHSYFQSPQGGEHRSRYSGILCLRCADLGVEDVAVKPWAAPNIALA